MPFLLRQAYYATCPYLANHHRRPTAAGHHCRNPATGHLPTPPPATTVRLPPPTTCHHHCPSQACHCLQGTNSIALYSPLKKKYFVSLNGLEH
ncbi:hypothetical protein GBA52_013410 [Prunus armeniaca]|nr:hypothetical protein GBA52_013410 [Prunus armeniaca]